MVDPNWSEVHGLYQGTLRTLEIPTFAFPPLYEPLPELVFEETRLGLVETFAKGSGYRATFGFERSTETVLWSPAPGLTPDIANRSMDQFGRCFTAAVSRIMTFAAHDAQVSAWGCDMSFEYQHVREMLDAFAEIDDTTTQPDNLWYRLIMDIEIGDWTHPRPDPN